MNILFDTSDVSPTGPIIQWVNSIWKTVYSTLHVEALAIHHSNKMLFIVLVLVLDGAVY